MANSPARRQHGLTARSVFLGLILSLAPCVFSAPPPFTAAEDMPVDGDSQGSMFRRIFSYDKHLRNSDKIVVIVVCASRESKEVTAIVEAFREKDLYPAPVNVENLTEDLVATLTAESTVIYIMPGVDYVAVNTFTERHGMLSVSGLPSIVEAGHASVGMDLYEKKPRIVVNIPRLQTEGHELSAELLNIARIIR